MTSEYRRAFENGYVQLLVNSGYMDGIFLSEDVDVDNPEVIECIKSFQRAGTYLRSEEWVLQWEPRYWDYDGSDIIHHARNLLEAPFDVIPENAYSREKSLKIVRGEIERPKPKGKGQSERVYKPGFVYLLKSADGSHKIGRTKNPKQRLNTFKNMVMAVEYACLIETNDMNRLEADLHIKFKDKRIQGEWFDLNDEDIEYIKGLA